MVFNMNALELADKLSQFGKGAVFANIKLTDVATMLRQQQVEIDKMKNLLLDNQILLDKTLNAWAKEMERK
jgi:hypothetical protein